MHPSCHGMAAAVTDLQDPEKAAQDEVIITSYVCGCSLLFLQVQFF